MFRTWRKRLQKSVFFVRFIRVCIGMAGVHFCSERRVRQEGHKVSCEMLAVEDPVPRRALVVAPRADNVEVDAVDPVREVALAWRGGGVEERLDLRFSLCGTERGDTDPARKKTTNNVDATTIARGY